MGGRGPQPCSDVRGATVFADMTAIHPTRYWHALDDGRVQCDVCPRACKMHEGQRGLCFVRGVEGGEVRLYTYGRSSGFCVDPDREEAAESFPARHVGPVVRHGGLQSRLQVLPELGHQQVARDGHARRRGNAEMLADAARSAGLRERRLHVQRSRDLHGVRDRRRGRVPRARRSRAWP